MKNIFDKGPMPEKRYNPLLKEVLKQLDEISPTVTFSRDSEIRLVSVQDVKELLRRLIK